MSRLVVILMLSACSMSLSTPDPLPVFCGDGLVGDGESCDDGNLLDTDTCTTTCQPATCGDNHQREDLTAEEAGFEECDDGNQVETDACTSTCETARCGDGQVRADLTAGEFRSHFSICGA